MNTRLPLALVLTLAPLLSQVKDFTISQQLPTGTRIEVLQGATWVRANVSEDDGAGAANIKIRTEPNNKFMIVPRKSIRIAPRPSSLKVGDHVGGHDGGISGLRWRLCRRILARWARSDLDTSDVSRRRHGTSRSSDSRQ